MFRFDFQSMGDLICLLLGAAIFFLSERSLSFNNVMITLTSARCGARIVELASAYITNLLKPMSQVHSLNLRSSEIGSLYVPKSRTSLYSDTFSCSAPRLWNALPQCVRGRFP